MCIPYIPYVWHAFVRLQQQYSIEYRELSVSWQQFHNMIEHDREPAFSTHKETVMNDNFFTNIPTFTMQCPVTLSSAATVPFPRKMDMLT